MKKALALLPALLILTACTMGNNSSGGSTGSKAVIETPNGKITITLSDADAPKTVENFKKLVTDGFYNGLTWHRVVKAPTPFVIQTGDPTGTGSGGSTDKVQLEIKCADGTMTLGQVAPATCDPMLKHKRGAVGMARTQDPNSASSQFYITLAETPSLDRGYAVFGYVDEESMKVADQVNLKDVITKVTLE